MADSSTKDTPTAFRMLYIEPISSEQISPHHNARGKGITAQSAQKSTYHFTTNMKKAIIALMALISSVNAAIVENVCIDFGEEDKYDSSTGWNIQEGRKTSSIYANRETTPLTDKQTGTSSNIKVTFEHATGINLGNSTPTTGSSPMTKPTKEMQDVWELMHSISLTIEEVNSYWTEVIGVGLGASVGDLTVQNLKTNSTYAISAVVTSAKVLTLVGQAAPLNMKDNTNIDQKATF